ncbi:MAG: ParB N-terminal domain-containing protein [Nitrospiria bacterium]
MITIDKTTYYTPFIHLLPPLTDAEYTELRQGIIERGIDVPVVIDEQNNVVIDGHNRLRIAAELGITAIPFDIRPGLSDEDKAVLAWDLNWQRRQGLKKEQRPPITVALRQNGMTLEAIADKLGVDERTIRRDLEAASAIAEAGLPTHTIGKDGKQYPTAYKPRRPKILARNQREAQQAIKLVESVVELPDGIMFKNDIAKQVARQRTHEPTDTPPTTPQQVPMYCYRSTLAHQKNRARGKAQSGSRVGLSDDDHRGNSRLACIRSCPR